MISIENLFLLPSPKGISLQQVNGRGVFSRDDAINLVAQAQGKYPLGIKVLEVKIGGVPQSRFSLVEALKSALLQADLLTIEAKALAEMIVNEVCGAQTCPKCKGRQYGFGTRQGVVTQIPCKACEGSGVRVKNLEDIAKDFSRAIERDVSINVFNQMFFGHYKKYTTELWQEAGEAEMECRRLLRMWKNVAA